MNLYIIILSGLKRETVSYSLRKRMSFLFITDNAHGNIKFDNTIYQRIHFSLNILKKYFVTYIRHIAKIWCKFLHTLDVWHLNNAKWICIHKFKYNQFTTCMKKKNASLQRIFARMFSIRKPCRLVSLVTCRHFSQTIE